jgi:AraC family transcriptional activator of pobA
MGVSALPLFHLYGDPPDDSAFDFIHIETIASRSSIHDWTIRAHRHRNLFQVLLIEKGGGEMSFETATARFSAPAVILVPATTAHGFRFTPEVTWRSVGRSTGAIESGCRPTCAPARQHGRGEASLDALR